MRRNQFRAACPGIGWEREQQRKPTTIGGRSVRWQVTPVEDQAPVADPQDEDTVIVRGTD
ncbi:hypothetical protein [Actinophytocola sp. KF-1]